MKVSEFITNNKTCDPIKLAIYLPINIVNQIMKIYIPSTDIEDKLIWSFSSSGEFSTKSAVELTRNNAINLNSTVFTKMWNLNIPPKIKNFLWKALSEK